VGITFGQVARFVRGATRTETPASREEPTIEVLPEYLAVRDLLRAGPQLILVSGGAGTGKSTFIRWLSKELSGQVVIGAPTGIAAITAGGRTLHALCKLPPAWILAQDIKEDRKSALNRAKVLIIDEVSMVNANVLDAVDQYLKLNRSSQKPFGGMSIVLVGDMFQLPPVVDNSTRQLFESEYSSPKFFAARALAAREFRFFQLTKAFRQSDQDFVDLLGKVREGDDIPAVVRELNERCQVLIHPPEGAIWLAPRNVDVSRVNAERLAALPGPETTYEGKMEGNFRESQLPAPSSVTVKSGAQVVLLSNSKSWVNGSIATVLSAAQDKLTVRLASSGMTVEVPRYTWEQFDYVVNPNTGLIEREVIGRYIQMPIALAWAMTIHKSQGLTLDRVHIDLGAGAFETGQTYVALSRARSLSTLSLSRPIQERDILVDTEARAFYAAVRAAN